MPPQCLAIAERNLTQFADERQIFGVSKDMPLQMFTPLVFHRTELAGEWPEVQVNALYVTFQMTRVGESTPAPVALASPTDSIRRFDWWIEISDWLNLINGRKLNIAP